VESVFPDGANEPRTYRRRLQPLLGCWLGIGGVAAWVQVAKLASAGDIVGTILFGLVAVPVSWYSFRYATLAVVATDRGVRIRNILHTTEIPWLDLERVEIGRASAVRPAAGIAVKRSGERVGMAAVQGPTVGIASRDKFIAGTVRELNEMIAARRGGSGHIAGSGFQMPVDSDAGRGLGSPGGG
jgi:Bacterial PH domain